MILRRTKIAVLILILILGGILSGCDHNGKTTPPTAENTGLSAAWCQRIVSDFKDIQPGKIPDNLTEGDSSKTGGEFDVNKYFSVLTHLSMEKGYVLDYVYDFNGSAGSPIMYVRPEDKAPYKNYEEFATAANAYQQPENNYDLISPVMIEANGDSGNKIKIDGTNEGLFEYAVLQTLGSQFYLWWHANINDTRIVCQASEVESVINDIVNSGFKSINGDFKSKARKISVQPVVAITGDTAMVKLVVFSKWGGFSRYSFTVNRNYPHTIVNFQSEDLLDYNCGIVF